RPPRRAAEPLFDRRTVVLSFVQGLGILLVTFGVLCWALVSGLPEQDARALTFATLVIADLGLILANPSRSRSIFAGLLPRNRALDFVLGGAAALLVAIIAVPGLRELFSFGIVHIDDLQVIGAATLLALLWLEAVRLVSRRTALRAT